MRYMESENKLNTEFVELADEVISSGKLSSPGALLNQVLSMAKVTESVSHLGAGNFPSPAEIFDTFAFSGSPALRHHYEQFFEVMTLPGERLEENLLPGDLLIQRALGEGRLAHSAMIVTGELLRIDELASSGLRPESRLPGQYSQIVEAGPFPHGLKESFARRLTDEHGRLRHDGLILRVRHGNRRIGERRDNEAVGVRASEASTAENMETCSVAQHIPLIVRGYTIDLYVYIDLPDSEAKVRALGRFFERMPQQHLAVIYPIFVIENKPNRMAGGGTWRPSEVRSGFMGRQQITCVPDDDVQRLIVDPGRGLVGIPRDRWQRAPELLIFTVLHEVAHSVDYRLNLTPPGATEYDFRGVRPVCGAADAVKRRVAEAYARFIINPARICRDPVDGEDERACNRRVIGLLRQSPAFRSLPPNWMPGSELGAAVSTSEFGVFSMIAGGVSCEPGSSLLLHMEVVDGFESTRALAGENLEQANPLCAATRICPASFQSHHSTGDASHFVRLTPFTIRIAELAGLFGINLTSITGSNRVTRKADAAVKALTSTQPLGNLSFVAIRNGSIREIHIHRGERRFVESYVQVNVWKCLPFEIQPSVVYTLFKRRFHEASLHRQWGREAVIGWIKGLCNFYQGLTGLKLGIGDISHVVGEDMTDHRSHQEGRDVDVYVLDYPASSSFPDAYWCDGNTGSLTLERLTPPTSSPEIYDTAGKTRLAAATEQEVFRRYATILAYCVATWGRLDTLTWHGVTAIEAEAVQIARNAFDSGWRSIWGTGPARREDIAPTSLWNQRRRKLIGEGSSNYGEGRGWPPHHDHMHIRLNV